MLYNFNPMDVWLAFRRRLYVIDDTVHATVTFLPNGNVRVRKANLNLVARARLTEVKRGRSMGLEGSESMSHHGHASESIPLQETMQVKAGASVCYSAEFLSATTLRNMRPSTYDVDLEIGPHLPDIVLNAMQRQQDANSSLSIEQWWLEVEVDIVWGRNAIVRQEIDVNLP